MVRKVSHAHNVELVKWHSAQKNSLEIANKAHSENADTDRRIARQIESLALPAIKYLTARVTSQVAEIEAQQFIIRSQAAQIALFQRYGQCKFKSTM